MAEPIFDVIASELEAATDLDRLESRGTLRLLLKEAGLDAARVTGDQFAVAMRALLPVALASRGVGDVDRVCDRLVLLADGLGGGTASADSPEAMFGRFGR